MTLQQLQQVPQIQTAPLPKSIFDRELTNTATQSLQPVQDSKINLKPAGTLCILIRG